MAYADPRFVAHQVQTDGVLDAKHSALTDEDDSAVLDPSILDTDIMQSPNNTSFRKDSLANSNGVLSPAESQAWDHQYAGALHMDHTSGGASNPFHDDAAHLYGRPGSSHPSSFPTHQHSQPWSFEQGSGECTPTNAISFIPPPPSFDDARFTHHRADSVHGSFSLPHAPPPPPPPPQFSNTHVEAGFIPAPQVQTPMSPHSHQDWMGMAQQEMESRSGHRRMRPGSPPRPIVDFQRRDGIRKKNGRIDIPQERNIHTIDELIEKTSDEELLKELKQQKRLLRNREAALASRQRKKKHTEDLEVKEKTYNQQIASLDKQVSDLIVEREHRERERQAAMQRLQEAQRIIDALQDEKRDLCLKHNEESSTLRKRIQLLTDQLELGPAPNMSAAPSSAGYTDFNAEMEALNMGAHEWDNFIFANDLQADPQDDVTFEPKPELSSKSPTLGKKASTATIVPTKASTDDASEQSITAPGLLFMLLLCGAFIASKPPSSQPPDMPNVPADVRAAAPTVLNNLLAESGPSSSLASEHALTRMGAEPMASSSPYGAPAAKTSRLDRMHRSLTAPTKQQEIDQAFSLTSAQYASITNMDYAMYGSQPDAQRSDEAPPRRRNLAEALASLDQEHTRTSKAEVYTRSLLWDQIPLDVVKQFKEMVRDHHEIEARQQHGQQQARGNDFTYNPEQ